MASLRLSVCFLFTLLVLMQKGECRKCRSCSTVTLESSGDLLMAPVDGAAKVRTMTLKEETSTGGKGTCVSGTTFGFIGPETYVDMGCSGEFEVCFVEGRAETLTCNSDGGDVTLCEFDNPCEVRSIALLETISSAPCIEGFSFTSSNNGVSVMKGCEATFTVGCRGCAF